MQYDKPQKQHSGGHRILLLSLLCLFGFCLLAQKPVRSPQTTPPAKTENQDNKEKQRKKLKQKKSAPRKKQQDNKLYLVHSDILKKTPLLPEAQILVGNVTFRHGNMYMYCDSAHYYDQSGSFEAYDNIKMIQADTLKIYGDHLYYDAGTQIAQLRRNVRMENRSTTLLTDSLNYDRLYNLGYYFDGGTLMDESNVLTSEWGEYNPSTKQAIFNYNVRLVGSNFTLTSDTLRYNTATKVVNIVGPSEVISEENTLISSNGTYNTQTGKAHLLQRSLMISGNRTLTGDTLDYDKESGVGEAFGNVVMNDTAQKNMLLSHYGFYNEKTGYALATQRAMAIDYSQGDSLFLHADTLMMESFDLNTDSTYRIMRAYHKVRFYRNDMQGVADSMVFSSKDSCLVFYKDPILWSGNRQLLGEEIRAYMNDSTVEWAHIINQALSVEQVDSTRYNQVSGKEMKAYFKNKQIEKAEVIGSVRLIYYPLEQDSTVMGMNVSETSRLDIYLINGEFDHMTMSPQSSGQYYALPLVPPDKEKLPTFVWFDYIRPLNKEDIFNWRGKKATEQLKVKTRAPIRLPNQHLFEQKK